MAVKKTYYSLCMLLGIILYCVVLGMVSYFRLYHFFYSSFNLALYSQAFWNCWNGTFFSSLLGINIFGFHLTPLLFLVTPLYSIFWDPYFLTMMQIISIGVGAWGIYLIGKKISSRGIGFLFSCIYLFYPPLLWIASCDFNLMVVASTFLIFAYYCILSKRFFAYVICLLFACICNENVTLLVAMLGLYTIIKRYPLKWSLYSMCLGLLWYCLAEFYFIPLFAGDIPVRDEVFTSLWTMLRGVSDVPIYLGVKGVMNMILPVAGLSFLSPIFLVMCSPIIIKNNFFYASWGSPFSPIPIAIIPFVFLSALYGFRKVFFLKRKYKTVYFLIVVLSVVFVNFYFGPYKKLFQEYLGVEPFASKMKHELLASIPEDAALVSSFSFLPLLSHRTMFQTFAVFLSNVQFDPTEYILVDFSEKRLFYEDNYSEKIVSQLQTVVKENNYGVVKKESNVVLFKHNSSSSRFLYEVMDTIPKQLEKYNNDITGVMNLVAYQTMLKADRKRVDFQLCWRPTTNIKKNLGFLYMIIDEKENYVVRAFPSCYYLYPTTKWKPNEVIVESYSFSLPPTFSSVVQVFIQIVPVSLIYSQGIETLSYSLESVRSNWIELPVFDWAKDFILNQREK